MQYVDLDASGPRDLPYIFASYAEHVWPELESDPSIPQLRIERGIGRYISSSGSTFSRRLMTYGERQVLSYDLVAVKFIGVEAPPAYAYREVIDTADGAEDQPVDLGDGATLLSSHERFFRKEVSFFTYTPEDQVLESGEYCTFLSGTSDGTPETEELDVRTSDYPMWKGRVYSPDATSTTESFRDPDSGLMLVCNCPLGEVVEQSAVQIDDSFEALFGDSVGSDAIVSQYVSHVLGVLSGYGKFVRSIGE